MFLNDEVENLVSLPLNTGYHCLAIEGVSASHHLRDTDRVV